MITPVVSICCVTYNHIHFLKECLDGFLMQKTSFPIEILIHDDASTDGTTELIKTYENKYPELIKPLYQRENQFSKGKKITPILLKKARGKYIALCEGDDYWTDPLKLQKQVDFLEGNGEYVICFHRANLLRENNSLSLHPIPEISVFFKFKYSDLLRYHNFIATASVVFRKPEDFSIPKWFTKITFGDLGLYKILTLNGGSIKCLNEVMSVYRIHEKGIYSKFNKREKDENYLRFYSIIYPILSKEEKQIVVKKHKNKIENVSKLIYPKFEWKQYLYKLQLRFRYPLRS